MDCKAIIIGTGFGGQAAAVNLLARGIEDFIMLERSAAPGGTWCQHAYPGAAVDVHSPLYSLSFEPYVWSRMFAERDELAAYTNHVIDKHGLRQRFRLEHNVTGISWDEGAREWQLQIEGRPELRARYVINASGLLSQPKLPDFPGQDDFLGESFHSAHWNSDFDYRGKRVAVIGGGASAAQIVPAIAPDVAELHVFQRTPHWLLPRPEHRFSGFERRLLARPWAYKLLRGLIYLGLETRILGFKYSQTFLNLAGRRLALKQLRKQISDPDLRARLTPDFEFGCRRVVLSSRFYPALTRENVVLHDRASGVERLTKTGIRTKDGQRIDLDCVIYSTGYKAADGLVSYPVSGRGGRQLSQVWNDFARAFVGSSVPGFPNFFLLFGPNSGVAHTSALLAIEAQAEYAVQAVAAAEDAGKSIEVSPEAEATYTEMIHRQMQGTVWASGCESWYRGKSDKITAIYPGFTFTFRKRARNFRLDDHVLS